MSAVGRWVNTIAPEKKFDLRSLSGSFAAGMKVAAPLFNEAIGTPASNRRCSVNESGIASMIPVEVTRASGLLFRSKRELAA